MLQSPGLVALAGTCAHQKQADGRYWFRRRVTLEVTIEPAVVELSVEILDGGGGPEVDFSRPSLRVT